jgi:hypothetical protein
MIDLDRLSQRAETAERELELCRQQLIECQVSFRGYN